MLHIAILVGVVLLLQLVKWMLPTLIARLFGRQVGRAALARQPDHIHLVAAGPDAWKRAEAARALAAPLLAQGFADAGVHRIPEMPGVVVQLLAEPREGFLAVLYEHPIAGSWSDVFTRYDDGSSCTFTSSKPTGLEPRPGHLLLHMPGAAPPALLERARKERPAGARLAHEAAGAVAIFEQGYAESMAWRKHRGISTAEVVNVAQNRAA